MYSTRVVGDATLEDEHLPANACLIATIANIPSIIHTITHSLRWLTTTPMYSPCCDGGSSHVT